MNRGSYAISVNFDSESGSPVLGDTANVLEIVAVVQPYVHGVIDESLPVMSIRFESDLALQDRISHIKA